MKQHTHKCPVSGKFNPINSRGHCKDCKPKPVKGDRTPKKEPKPIKKVRKATGEKELFEQIALERPHVCFVTGEPIKELTVSNFAHVLSKGAYSGFRLYKKNIVLVQEWVHTCYDFGPRAKLEPYPGYKKLLDLHDELIAEYYQG